MFGGGFEIITGGEDGTGGKGCQNSHGRTARVTNIGEFVEVRVMVEDVGGNLVDSIEKVMVGVAFDV